MKGVYNNLEGIIYYIIDLIVIYYVTILFVFLFINNLPYHYFYLVGIHIIT
jgi:hypothetical protein